MGSQKEKKKKENKHWWTTKQILISTNIRLLEHVKEVYTSLRGIAPKRIA